MDQEIRQIVYAAMDSQAALLPNPIDLTKGDATPIFGAGGAFDSLGLVTLVMTIEDMVETRMGLALTLVSEKAMSAHRSPFATVGSLSTFIKELIEESNHA